MGGGHRARSGEARHASLRSTKAVLIDRRTRNLRAVQLVPGHPEIESTVRDLGTEVDHAIELAEEIDI